MPAATDERRHEPGADTNWCESWGFWAGSSAGAVAVLQRLWLWPNRREAWCWAACRVGGEGEPLLLVRDQGLRLPRPPLLEVRGEGLWAEISCLSPHDHWSVGLEAFALGLDDPAVAWGDERGDRVPLGFDLDWHGDGDVTLLASGGYEQAARAEGEVLVGDRSFQIDEPGGRDHRWGVADWTAVDHVGVGEPLDHTAVPLQAEVGGVRVRLLHRVGEAGWSATLPPITSA